MDNNNNDIKIDLSYLKEVSSDNTEFMVEMIDIFLEQTPEYIDVLSTAIKQMDWTKIAEMAHKIKPTLAFVGVDSARDAMASIETRARNKEDYNNIVTDYNLIKEKLTIIFDKLKETKKELLTMD